MGGSTVEKLVCALRERGIDTRESCSLVQFNTFRVGGRARVAVFPHTREELIDCLALSSEAGVRYAVFGNASNVVFSDSGFDGVVIFTFACRAVSVDGNAIIADAGVPLGKISILAQENGLVGAEFLYGIPGTVGGGVFMNAGAFGSSIEGICAETEYWNPQTGKIERLCGAEHEFEYRTSAYAKHPERILVGARFVMDGGDRAESRRKMDDFMARRRNTQPLDLPSAGSVFKRPEEYFAGKLIEDCGLKGYTVGGAQVSQKHAGFIVNIGGATAMDIKRLVRDIRAEVLQSFGVNLECEIRFID